MTENYTYDPLYQLTQVAQGLTTTESYTYDAVGNRLSSLGMSPYAYNSSNELTSTPSATFTYDANGNTLTKVDSNGTTTYGWDFENRLTSVQLPAGAGTVTFKYDPFGRRIQKRSSSGTTNYLYDGSNSAEEVDQAGAELAHYSQGAGIDEPLAAARGGAVGFYEQDGLGSVASLTASTGAVLNSYTYDSFGNVAALSGSFVNPFLYTGRDYDPETGLRHYRARYYDPQIGRFLGEDPLKFAGGGSEFYAYVRNNPLNLVDPTGMLVEAICEPVQQKHLGILFDAVHCRLHVQGDDFNDTYEWLGGNNAGSLKAEPFDPSRPGYKLPVDRPENNTSCKNFENCIKRVYEFYAAHPEVLPKYDWWHANSNGFVLNLIRSCGGDLDYPIFHYVGPFDWIHIYGVMPSK